MLISPEFIGITTMPNASSRDLSSALSGTLATRQIFRQRRRPAVFFKLAVSS